MRKPETIALLTLLAFSDATVFSAQLYSQTQSGMADAAQRGPIATTQQGKVLGQLASDGSTVFQSIPYARPPVGDLRWRDPEPPPPWSGLRDGTRPAPACMQGDWSWNAEAAKNANEDCLYLNTATPSWPPTQKLPVIFWIHGGANYNGSGGLRDQTLTRHGVVLVSINYRLGVFGFLAHPDITRQSTHHSSGNYAILDQIAALHWVQQNIAAAASSDAALAQRVGQELGRDARSCRCRLSPRYRGQHLSSPDERPQH